MQDTTVKTLPNPNESNLKKYFSYTMFQKPLFIFIIGFIVGFIMYGVVFDYNVVNPLYTDWIYDLAGDRAQHDLGWRFFRRTEWQFPIGLIDGLTSDGAVSCTYSDSIPLLAIPFKLLSPILPDEFQYFGLWELFTFSMMGGCSALLLRKFSKNPIFCAIGAIPFSASTTIVHRAFGHEALSAQWIVIIAFLLFVTRDRKWKHKATPVVLWSLLGVTTALVHMYFIPMIYMVMAGYIFVDVIKDKKIVRPLLVFSVTTLCTVATMYVIGVFYGDTPSREGGLGVYSANYNALFNPIGCSKFLKSLNQWDGARNGEGLGYLGLGIILLAFVSIILVFNKLVNGEKPFMTQIKEFVSKNWVTALALILVFAGSFFVAASPKGALNGRLLYDIQYPEEIMNCLSIFRASGRFVWVPMYMVYTLSFAVISKLDSKKTSIFVITLCAAIQLLDLRDFFRGKREQVCETEYNHELVLQGEEWNKMCAGKKEFIIGPLPNNYKAYTEVYFPFAEYAVEHDMNMSSFYLGRANYTNLKNYADEQFDMLYEGNGRDDAIYVFIDNKFVPENQENFDIYEIGDFTVATAK